LIPPLARRVIPSVLVPLLIGLGLARYFANLPHCFDILLDDEAVYLGIGTDFGHTILWPAGFPGVMASYENGGLYSLIYGALSALWPDPVDLYVYGGTAIVLAAVAAGFLAIWALSDSLLCAVLITCPVVLSGELLIWPRVSFAAIAVLALALAAMRWAPAGGKVPILLGAAYLVCFIRPECVLSFYLLLVLQIGLLGALLIRRPPGRWRAEAGAAALSLGFVTVLSLCWSLPVPAGGERAFAAFGQHFALRYVEAHGLALNPWLDWRQVMAEQFPGAGSAFEALQQRPGTVLAYFGTNLAELVTAIYRLAATTIAHHPVFFGLWALAAVAWIGSAFAARKPTPAAPGRWLDLALAALFALPPLIAAIGVYPRHHHIVLLLFAMSAALAILLRPLRGRFEPILALGLAIGFVLSVEPVPEAPQPMLETVGRLRVQQPIHRFYEIDGGWCYFVVPRCSTDYPTWRQPGQALIPYVQTRGIDAIMLSPRLKDYEAQHDPDFSAAVEGLVAEQGWQRVELGHGYVLLTAP
jgi:hypothetical protein